MMRAARRASLLVAFCLVASAPTVYAECAWVLWTETTERAAGSEKTSWEWDKNSHETRKACELALPTAVNNKVAVYGGMGFSVVRPGEESPASGKFVVKQPPPFRSVSAGSRGEDGKVRWVTVYEFYCFPDTIDPRGPKRDGR